MRITGLLKSVSSLCGGTTLTDTVAERRLVMMCKSFSAGDEVLTGAHLAKGMAISQP